MEEVTHSEELGDPVREPIKGRTIILGDWFTYRGKRYKVVAITSTSDKTYAAGPVPGIDVVMQAAR